MRALEGRFGKQDAVVGDDADRPAIQMGETGDQCGAVVGLEFVKGAVVHQTQDDFTHVERFFRISRNHAVQFFGGMAGRARWLAERAGRALAIEPGHALACQRNGVGIVERVVVGHPGNACVHIGPAEFFGADLLASGGFDQRRASQKNGALLAHDDGFVGHGRHIGASGGTTAHYHGNLRDAHGRQGGLVEENAPEVVAVGKYLVLHRQEGAAGIDEVNAGQGIVAGDVLRAQVLFDRHRVIGAALDGGVVGDDDAFGARDQTDAGHDAGPRRFIAVLAKAGELGKLQKSGARIDQQVDAFARQQLAAGNVLVAGGVTTSQGCRGDPVTQVGHQHLHAVGIGKKIRRARRKFRFEDRHAQDSVAGAPAGPARRGGLPVFGHQFAADQPAADFAGAGADLVELGITQQATGRIVVDVAVATEALDGIQC